MDTKTGGGPSVWATRGGLFVLFLLGGVAVLVFGSGYFVIFPTNNNPLYLAGLAALFLVSAVLLRGSARFKQRSRQKRKHPRIRGRIEGVY